MQSGNDLQMKGRLGVLSEMAENKIRFPAVRNGIPYGGGLEMSMRGMRHY